MLSQACCPLPTASSCSTRRIRSGFQLWLLSARELSPNSSNRRLFLFPARFFLITDWFPLLSRMVEVNVAIIVSCLPAFAQLLKLHVGDSAFFRSLMSAIRGRTGHSESKKSSHGSGERPKLATIGSEPPQRRRNYYELTDTALLTSQATAADNEPDTHVPSSDGIYRSTVISQHGEFRSTERLA